LRAYQGRYIASIELAYEAIAVERGLLGDTVGCQDQVLAAVGGLRRVEFRRVDDIVAENLCIAPARKVELQSHLVMVYTALQRPASPLERSKLDRVDANRTALRRMVAMVDEAADLLLGTAPIEGIGELLDESWRLKRSLAAGVSSDAMDTMYQRGRDAGALGGKILGAGGGGFFLFFVPPEHHEALVAAFPDHEILRPQIDRPGSEVLFASPGPES
ncbi:MAG: GHMP kinase, partial [Acidobacteriota bacterium]